MTYRQIDKLEGFGLSIPCMALYFLFFHGYNKWLFGSAPDLFSWNMRVFIVGVIIHMMYFIPAGETATLTFQGKSTKKIWDDGVVFVPNIFHFTITWFHSTLTVLWGLKLADKEYAHSAERLQGEVFANQMMPRYNRNTQMSKIAADFDRAINFFGFWLFGWKRGEQHLVFMRFGFRLMVIAYLWATFAGAGNYASRKASETANQATAAFNSALGSAVGRGAQFLGVPPRTGQGQDAVRAMIAYCDTARPVMPLPDFFTPSTDEGKIFYRIIDNDPRKYFRYAEAPPGKINTGWVREPSCYTVPPGREILFMSRIPPRCAVNMETKAHFKVSERGILFTRIHEVDVTWYSLNNNWWDISKDAGAEGMTNFKAKALKMSDLPPGSFGGIVCF